MLVPLPDIITWLNPLLSLGIPWALDGVDNATLDLTMHSWFQLEGEGLKGSWLLLDQCSMRLSNEEKGDSASQVTRPVNRLHVVNTFESRFYTNKTIKEPSLVVGTILPLLC
jgi:hypothetical protein